VLKTIVVNRKSKKTTVLRDSPHHSLNTFVVFFIFEVKNLGSEYTSFGLIWVFVIYKVLQP
jgi:hypothetical protein